MLTILRISLCYFAGAAASWWVKRPSGSTTIIAAIGEAQRLAQERAGVVVFARTRDHDGRNVEIIFKTGDVPDDVPRRDGLTAGFGSAKHARMALNEALTTPSRPPERSILNRIARMCRAIIPSCHRATERKPP